MLHSSCTHMHTHSPQHLLPGLETLASAEAALIRSFSFKEVQATLFCKDGTESEGQLTFSDQKGLERSRRGLQDWLRTYGQPGLRNRLRENRRQKPFFAAHIRREQISTASSIIP